MRGDLPGRGGGPRRAGPTVHLLIRLHRLPLPINQVADLVSAEIVRVVSRWRPVVRRQCLLCRLPNRVSG